MIQRIQSLLLLLAAACSFSLFAFPFATSASAIVGSDLFGDARYDLQDSIFILLLFVLAGVLALVAIFLFRNRKNQLILGRMSLLTGLTGMILVVIFFFNDADNRAGAMVSDSIGAYMPVVSIIFTLIALRNIKRDEKLIRSMDRLR